MTSVFLDHPSSYAHETGAHPEQPARISAIEEELAPRDWFGFKRVRSPAVDRGVLTAVHPDSYVASIEQLVARGGGQLDWDTVTSPGSFDAALHAAGGAVRMVELLLDGEARWGFSAHRPPGHHATGDRAMGFCLFNNVAVAASFAIDQRGLDRVLILDWDVHHGNGTNDIFHSSSQVLFVSIHQSPHYPGTGPAEDVGSGPGRGFTVNLPVAPASGDDLFGSLVADVAVPLARSFRPQLVLISAGYDAHREDPLGDCQLSERGFAAMASTMRGLCEELEVPMGCVLEGGYALGALARSVAATMEALSELADGEQPRPGIAPEATRARQRLREWWPELRG
ncbi:MAG TPA: histone deacetylase [Solirubrobacteraceae bacterium]|nr:histone deacetylase [Solirubrobacteraceae bacterium]